MMEGGWRAMHTSHPACAAQQARHAGVRLDCFDKVWGESQGQWALAAALAAGMHQPSASVGATHDPAVSAGPPQGGLC